MRNNTGINRGPTLVSTKYENTTLLVGLGYTVTDMAVYRTIRILWESDKSLDSAAVADFCHPYALTGYSNLQATWLRTRRALCAAEFIEICGAWPRCRKRFAGETFSLCRNFAFFMVHFHALWNQVEAYSRTCVNIERAWKRCPTLTGDRPIHHCLWLRACERLKVVLAMAIVINLKLKKDGRALWSYGAL